MAAPKIALLDYGVGNLYSVANALSVAGGDVVITSDPKVIQSADKVMLPGVGAMRDAMANMVAHGIDIAVKDALANKPVMAICVGMQAMFDYSEEGDVPCLGIIKGAVRLFDETWVENGHAIKVPHVGWNRVDADTDHELWNGCNHEHFYFTHSYYCDPEGDDRLIIATTEYGEQFCSSIIRDNLFITQFHPEKSHNAGLKLLSNFIKWQP